MRIQEGDKVYILIKDRYVPHKAVGIKMNDTRCQRLYFGIPFGKPKMYSNRVVYGIKK